MNSRIGRSALVSLALLPLSLLTVQGCDGETGTQGNPGGAGGTAAVCEEEKDLAPVPDVARGVMIDQTKGYYREEIGSGLHFLTNGVDQVMFLTTGQGVILVDAPPSLGAAIPKAIAEVTDEKITHVVYSHLHSDHIGAAGDLGLGPDVKIFAHAETAAALEAAKDPRRPAVTDPFDAAFTLTVGSQTLELSYDGTNHVAGNIFIFAPAQKVLMVVDVVWPGWVPFTQLGLAKDVGGYVRAVDVILAYDFDVFIGGHVGRYGTRKDVEEHGEYLADLRTNAVAALTSVDFGAVAGEVGYDNTWNLVDSYFGALVEQCGAATEDAWVGRLGGADVWSRANCFAMIQHLRID
jgi:glyoxylase-like metal-dependent hydrolase (beta-lactamase superfamily II)